MDTVKLIALQTLLGLLELTMTLAASLEPYNSQSTELCVAGLSFSGFDSRHFTAHMLISVTG